MKLHYWINNYNTRVCYKIVSKYHRGLDNGKNKNYKYTLSFYRYYLLRLLLLVLDVLTFNRDTYRTFQKVLSSSYSAHITPSTSNREVKFKEFFYTFFGFRQLALPDLLPLLPSGEILKRKISFIHSAKPVVSIIIPVYNHLDFTFNCLQSIKNHCGEVDYEVIIVDDFSTDLTRIFVENNIQGAKYFKNNKNIGFLQSCIRGIENSTAKYICLLNNDTQVTSGWLQHLITTIGRDEKIGCVGSKLIYADGLLQEAGGIVFTNGDGANYGRHDKPDRARYNYVREVDYCSGASILFRKSDYEAVQGLDVNLSPAYYEDTDFCFLIRHNLNKKVVYQPLSTVVHFEGVSSGKSVTAGSIKYFQEVNRHKFIGKWSHILHNYCEPGEVEAASRRLVPKKNILFIDLNLPFYDKDSGSKRIFSLMKVLSADYHLCFMPDNGRRVEPYYSDLVNLGVEVLHHWKDKPFMRNELEFCLRFVSWAWISRPELNKKYSWVKASFPNIKWIYDTVDLHYLRFERALKFKKGDRALMDSVNHYRSMELSLAKAADLTIAITKDEKEELRRQGIKNISVVPNLHEPTSENGRSFSERSGVLFIGGYKHEPNVDAAWWLVNEIMPLVWESNPDITVTLLGSDPSTEVLTLASDKVFVPGYIHDVSEYFYNARLFVAPLRYGAGMKGKVGQRMGYKLPIVTTPIGAEGMDLVDKEHAIIASDPKAFASGILELYNGESLWNKIRGNSVAALSEYRPEAIKVKIKKEIFENHDSA